MTANIKISQRLMSLILSIALIVTCLPLILTAATASESSYTLESDPSTIDGWKNYFPVSGDLTTLNAGAVWTDKSVFNAGTTIDGKSFALSGKNSFLVALSAIGSNMSVTGKAAVPTDTVMILDTSGSMQGSAARAMINAVNVALNQLMKANKGNRVAIVFFDSETTTYLPLAHYETADEDGRFLNIDYRGSTISLNSDVTDGNGKDVSASSRSWSVSGGTYTALGLKQAMNVLTASSNVLNQSSAPRIPVIMLFSDGIPTYAANNFTNPPSSTSSAGIGNGQNSGAGVSEVFATELTASYVKTQITAKYGSEYEALFYTLGKKGTEDNALREAILDPENKNTSTLKNAWRNYNALSTGATIRVDNEQFTKIDTPLSSNYVDGYFDVDSYQSGSTTLEEALSKAFSDVVSEIVSKSVYSPTLLEGNDHNLSGYVSFVDKIGAYMEITDVKGIVSGGKFFTGEALAHALADAFEGGKLDESSSLVVEGIRSGITRLGIDSATAQKLLQNAYDHGQISYDPATGAFSNWIGWISDAQGAFLDVWYEGMPIPINAAHINASYIFLGAEGGTDMMYTTVRVREKVNAGVLTGEQDVAFAVPASLLPKITYKVDLDENKNVTNIEVNPDTPIYLVYEVSLDSEINPFNIKDKVSASYLAANTDPLTGEVYFYTNAWERTPDENGKLTGYNKVNTYSYFRPSHQNDRYYYQNDSLVYSDTAGTVYKGNSHPSTQSGKMYYYYYYYVKAGNTFKTVTEHHELPKEVLSVAVANGDGTYTVKAGTIRNDYYGDVGVVSKKNNTTGTLSTSHEVFYDSNSYAWNDASHDAVVGITMGNNGRIAIAPQTGIRINKTLAPEVELGENENPIFTFDVVSAGVDGEIPAYAYRYVNGELVGLNETVTFDNGKAAVSIKAGETLYIGGLPEGTVTVTERTYIEYVVQSIAIGGIHQDGVTAGVVLTKGEIKEINFINTLRGTGNFTVAKEIIHNYGAGYKVPANSNTEFEVELTFTFDGKPLSGKYAVAQTGGTETEITLNGTAGETVKIKLHHDDQFTVYGLPDETVVSAVENLTAVQQNSFTPTYEGGISEIVVKANTTEQVIINNTYEAEAATPTIKVSGTKSLTGHAYTGSFTFVLQKYNGTGAHMSDSSWTTIEQQTVSYNNATNGKNFVYDYDFTSESFTEIGTYIYRIKEEKPAVEGMVYDPKIHTFQIDVTDNDMDGKLEVSVSTTRAPQVEISGSGNSWEVKANFNNEYTNDHVVTVLIGAQKDVSNPTLSPLGTSLAGFEFGLYDNNGNLIERLTTTGIGSVIFNRTYKVADIGTHIYTLKEIAPANIPEGWDYTAKEVKITVTVSHVPGENHLQAVVVTDDSTASVNGTNAEVTFTNTYTPDSASLVVDFVSKELTNRAGNRVLKDGEFSFAIYEVVNGVRRSVVALGTNGADGKVTFDKALTYDKVGGPYHYEIVEIKPDNAPSYITYDTTVYKMLVTVTDEGGKLVATPVVESVAYNNIVFKNTYTAEPTSLTISGTKTLTGRPLLENDFQFILSQVGSTNTWYVGNKAPNGNTAAFAFPALTFAQVGTYTYEVSEYNPAAADSDYFDGVKYDDTVYTVVVTVTDNGEGKLVATYTVDGNANKNIAFNNIYTPKEITFNVTGTKAIIGRDFLPTDEFTFDLYSADYDPATQKWTKGSAPIRTTENNVYGAIVFDGITAAKAGTYRYIVTEREENGKGITYDLTEWKVVVTVTDDHHGNLRVSSISYMNDDGVQLGMVFENTYTATAGALEFGGTKTLIGRPLKANEFSFTLYASDENRTEISALQTVKNGANGKFAFDKIEFESAGTYYYIVKEDAGTLNGITYDDTVYFVKAEVTDNLEGKLVVEYTIYDEANAEQNAVAFENTYTATAGSLSLGGIKTLVGRLLKANEFSFTLYASDANKTVGTAVETVKNGADGKFAFAEITFDEAGTYYYIVKEDAGAVNGVTYDNSVYFIKVVVTDDQNGKLVVEYTIYDAANAEKNDISFKNTYTATAGSLNLGGIKTLVGRLLKANEFSFTLYASDANKTVGKAIETVKNGADGKFAFAEITFDEAGTYYYIVKEDAGTLNGVTYDNSVYFIKVVVTDDQNGKLVVEYTIYDAANAEKNDISFKNTYSVTAGSLNLGGIKTLVGRLLKANEFSFTLYASDENRTEISALQTVKNGADGKFTFAEITFDEAGTYYYIVKEDAGAVNGVTYDNSVYFIKVVVTDDQNGKLVVEYTIYDAANAEKNDISFKNTYTATAGSLNLGGIKTLVGRLLKADEFSFTLYASDANKTVGTAVETVKNAADGKFAFAEITFDEAGTYYYIVKEDAGAVNGVTYDNSVYFIKVVVTDDQNGKLVVEYTIYDEANAEQNAVAFENTYTATAGSLSLGGIKTLVGRLLKANEFSFTLYASDANKTVGTAIETVKNGADGKFAFAEITFDEAGTYHYLVKEDAGAVNGVTYDNSVYFIKVVVTDDQNGKLIVEYTIYDEANAEQEAISFKNTYTATAGSLNLGGIKTLVGRLLKANEFSFTLYASDANKTVGTAVETVKNGADGKFSFAEITFDEAGTYYYIVKEDAGAINGVTYDNSVYFIKVVVTDDQNGKLTVAYTIYGENDEEQSSIAFKNTYSATAAALSLNGIKTLIGRTLNADEFGFTLYTSSENKSEGSVIQTVKNGADGKFAFDEMRFDTAGTYYYLVKEDIGDLANVTYDETVYLIKVVVTDDQNGKLVIEYTIYDETDAEQEAIAFENIYHVTVNPDTGDNVVMWLVPVAVSGAIITLALAKKRRRDDED